MDLKNTKESKNFIDRTGATPYVPTPVDRFMNSLLVSLGVPRNPMPSPTATPQDWREVKKYQDQLREIQEQMRREGTLAPEEKAEPAKPTTQYRQLSKTEQQAAWKESMKRAGRRQDWNPFND